jgi:hypothetical protein
MSAFSILRLLCFRDVSAWNDCFVCKRERLVTGEKEVTENRTE